jgi:hypothetical protein
MDKKEVLDSMSIRELQNAIFEKQKEEAIKKYGTLRETEHKISEIEELKAENHDHLYHVVVEDGSEGWEALVEVDREIEYDGDIETLVEDNIVNFMIENGYYENGDIEEIRVNEICRYSKPIFRIHK